MAQFGSMPLDRDIFYGSVTPSFPKLSLSSCTHLLLLEDSSNITIIIITGSFRSNSK
jgi:hypothetical protein